MPDDASLPARLSQRDLLVIFLRAGLAFGGGLAILAVLEEELVRKRRVIGQHEFLATYALGKVVPSGTMTALAVAYGYRFGGLAGTVTALVGLVLPAFVTTVLLTVGYHSLQATHADALLRASVLPGAVAFIAVAALQLARAAVRSTADLLVAAGAFAGA